MMLDLLSLTKQMEFVNEECKTKIKKSLAHLQQWLNYNETHAN